MRTDKSILMAFFLNISFAIFELVGGIFTNSVAIISDAMHDFGDAISIGVSYIFEKVSKRGVDYKYTYGYVRYSILGALFTNTILVLGSILVIVGAILRLINPVSINYDGMIVFAVLGVFVNFIAVIFTKGGNSLNEKAVNLHMLEDVFGWVVVLVGAIVMKFTELNSLDAILSVCVSIFIFINALKGLNKILDLFLEKIPDCVSVDEVKKHLLDIKGVIDVHHIHIWSIDGVNNCATMHVVIRGSNVGGVKGKVKELLREHGISHVTVEIESVLDKCNEVDCVMEANLLSSNHGHHHHH